MATLFISDLHLDPTQPTVTALFLDFLQRRAHGADACYILGDLFEAWVGDDDDALLASNVITALRQLTDSGVPTWFLHGNRDFLIGEQFAARSGIQLAIDYKVIDLYGESVVLLHGDTLCTDDVAYQAFRSQVRQRDWQARILALPLTQRRAMASQLRETSQHMTRQKADDIIDVNAATVDQTLRHHGVTRMIHGHTHRPAIHEWYLDGQPVRRAVLGDWSSTQGSILCCDPTGWHLESFCSRPVHA